MGPTAPANAILGRVDVVSHSLAPLSVVHVTSPGMYGGLETVVRLLARGQARAGHSVRVVLLGIASADGSHPFATSLAASGVTVDFIPKGAFPFDAERAELTGICRRVHADVLHTHGSRPDVVASRVGRGIGIATVATVHGVTGAGLKNHLMHWLEWRALRRLDAVIVVSRPLIATLGLKRILRDRLVYIPNAFASTCELLDRVDARHVLGVSDTGFVLGWVGRLSREKGADVLIESLPLLTVPRPTVVVIGDGPERASLVAQAEALGVAKDIRWFGAVPSAAPLFAGFDGFVLSSRSEGTPMCLFEAMDARTPVVVTAVGGVPDVVSASEALIVPPEQPAALAAAIDALVANRGAATARALMAHSRLRDAYGVHDWVQRHDTLYRRLITRTRHSH